MSKEVDIRLRIQEENFKALAKVEQGLARIEQQSSSNFKNEQRRQEWTKRNGATVGRGTRNPEVVTVKVISQEEKLAKLEREKAARMRALSNIAMGLGFNLLFTGMAIQRLAEGGLRSMINTYANAVGQMSEFGIITGRLQASWEFLKFSIIDALMQSGMAQNIIGILQIIVDHLNQLSPAAKESIGRIMIGLVLLGAIAQPVGMTLLALKTVLDIMALSPGLVPSMLKFAGAVGVAAVGLYLIYKILGDTERSGMDKYLTTLGVILFGVGLAAIFLGAAFGWPLMLIGLILLSIMMFKEEAGIAFSYLVDGLLVLGNAIVKMVISPLEAAIRLFNMLANWLGFSKITITPFKLVDAATGIIAEANQKRREELLAERETRGNPLANLGLGQFFASSPAAPSAIGPSAPTEQTTTNNGGSVTFNVQNYYESVNSSISGARAAYEAGMTGTPYGNS
jgi:hypothetical protein